MEKSSVTKDSHHRQHHCYNLRQLNTTSHKISKPSTTALWNHSQERRQTRYIVNNNADFRQLVQKLTGANINKQRLVTPSSPDNRHSPTPSDCSTKLTQQQLHQIQERFNKVTETAVPDMLFESENCSKSELVSSYGLHFRVEELGLVDPVATCSQVTTSTLIDNGKLNGNNQDSLLRSDSETILQAQMPPSFTVKQDQCKLHEEVDPKSQIMRDMSSSSFHDMLAKLEQMITEVGGDLTL